MSRTEIPGKERAHSEREAEPSAEPPRKGRRAREMRAVMSSMGLEAARYRRMAVRLDALMRARRLRHRVAWTAGTERMGDRRGFGD